MRLEVKIKWRFLKRRRGRAGLALYCKEKQEVLILQKNYTLINI